MLLARIVMGGACLETPPSILHADGRLSQLFLDARGAEKGP